MAWHWRKVASHHHLRRDAEEEVIIPPPHLQQEWGLIQDSLLQLTGVHHGASIALDDDVAIFDAASANQEKDPQRSHTFMAQVGLLWAQQQQFNKIILRQSTNGKPVVCGSQ